MRRIGLILVVLLGCESKGERESRIIAEAQARLATEVTKDLAKQIDHPRESPRPVRPPHAHGQPRCPGAP